MKSEPEIRYRRRFDVDPDQLQRLFEGGPHEDLQRIFDHSFTWITAHLGEEVIGWANVAWDGGVHFFLLDPTVKPAYRHRGIGTRLVQEAIEACRGQGDWLHVDAEEPLMTDFYINRCGFTPTPAGLINLRRQLVEPSRAD